MNFNVKLPFWFADYGGTFHAVRSDNLQSYKRLKRGQFVNLAGWIGDVRQIVVESAHLETHREKKSLAQPLTREQFETFMNNAKALGVVVRSAPEQLTPKVRTLYPPTQEKTKKNGQDRLDCEAWISYLQQTEAVDRSCLARPKKISQQELNAIHKFKDKTNLVLNWVRCFDTDTADRYIFEPETVSGMEIQKDYAAELIRSAGLHETKNGDYYSFLSVNPHLAKLKCCANFQLLPVLRYKQVYTLAVMIVDPWTGQERTRNDTGQAPPIKWLFRHICGFTPRHQRGGVARSNLMHHGLLHYKTQNLKNGRSRKKWNEYSDEEKHLMKVRCKEYRAAVKAALQLLRATYRGDVAPVNSRKEIADMTPDALGRLHSETTQKELFA